MNTIPASSDAKPPQGAGRTSPLVVTIDGPSGVGKSTVARLIASRLGYTYLDSGALYRAIAWKALATGSDPTEPGAMQRLCGETALNVSSACLRASLSGAPIGVTTKHVFASKEYTCCPPLLSIQLFLK